MYEFLRVSPLLASSSNIIDESGYLPRIAKKEIIFKDSETGFTFKTTDLEVKKFSRNKVFNEFKDTYERLFFTKKISILLIVIDIDKFKNVSTFLKEFKKKLSRKRISILGHIWTRDIGDIKYQRHFHVMLASTRISSDDLKLLLKTNSNEAKFILCKNPSAFKNYLAKKEIYAPHRKKSFGRSRKFLKKM